MRLLGIILFPASQAVVRKEDGFLGPSLITSLLSDFCPSFFHYFYMLPVAFFHAQRTHRRINEGKAKDLTLGNVYRISINISQRKEHLPIFWDHRNSCLIPCYLWFALEYSLYVLKAQILCNVIRGLIEKLYFYLYKLSVFHYVFS